MKDKAKTRKKRLGDAVMYALIPLLTIGTVTGIVFTHLSDWLRVSLAVTLGLTGCLAIIFYVLRWMKTYKILFLTLATCFVFVLIYIFLEQTGFMSIFNIPRGTPNRKQIISDRLRAYLSAKGQWATLAFILLQFAQTTILPIPAFAMTGAGAMLFTQIYGGGLGPLYNSLFSLVGIVLGSIASFWVGRAFGYKLVAWIVGKEPLKKTLEMIRGRDTVVLTLMFVLPFFPDDILCFVAGLSSMSTLYFLVMMTVSRIIVVFCTSYFVGLIPFTTWWGISIWAIILLGTAALFFVAFKKGDQIERYFRHKFARFRKKKKGVDFAQEIINKLDREIKEEAEENREIKSRRAWLHHQKK